MLTILIVEGVQDPVTFSPEAEGAIIPAYVWQKESSTDVGDRDHAGCSTDINEGSISRSLEHRTASGPFTACKSLLALCSHLMLLCMPSLPCDAAPFEPRTLTCKNVCNLRGSLPTPNPPGEHEPPGLGVLPCVHTSSDHLALGHEGPVREHLNPDLHTLSTKTACNGTYIILVSCV
jgi:hypothetical protein